MSRVLMEIPLIDMTRQYKQMKDVLDQSIQDVLASGNYIMGSQVKEFEQQVANYCGVKAAIGVANGTDALVLTLDALGIGPGDEVITSPFTFFATAESISRLGATPVFIDIDPDSYNLDVSKIEQAITPKTKAIIPVHLFGQPADMDEIMAIANHYNLDVIEDSCQSVGATYGDRHTGSIGKAGCFSFFPTKNLGGIGDGGMIITNSEELASRVRMLRVHGSTLKYIHSSIGYNSRLDTLQAAFLMAKLQHLDTWNRKRREKAHFYSQKLNHLPIKLPVEHPNRRCVYHLYIIQSEQRDELKKYLEVNGIASGIYYPVPLHQQQVYDYLGYQKGDLPVAEQSALKSLALPLFPEITAKEQEYVISVVDDFYSKEN